MKLQVLPFLMLFLLVSCQDNEQTGKVVLDKIFYVEANEVIKYVYENERVVRCEYYSDGKLIQYNDYFYTGDLLTTKKYYTSVLSTTGQFEKFSDVTIVYDLDNRATEFHIHHLDKDIVCKATWVSSSQLKEIEWIENGLSTITKFEYNAEGNIVQYTKYADDGSVNYILDCTYDNKPNPQYALHDPTDITFDFPIFSPNNIITMTEKIDVDGEVYAETEMSYTYHDNGWPKEREYKFTALGETRVTRSGYFYKRVQYQD